MVTLDTRLKALIGSTAGPLAKSRSLESIEDLIRFYPTRYVGYDSDLSELHEGEFLVAVGEVGQVSTRPMKARRGRMLTATLTDGRRDLEMTFFDARAHEGKLHTGAKVIAGGQLSRFNGRWQLAHPGYTLLDGTTDADLPGLFPLYPAVPKLHNWNLVRAIKIVLDALGELPDPIPAPLRERRELIGLTRALRYLHRPDGYAQIELARARMRYEEALVLQTVLAQRRATRAEDTAVARVAVDGAVLAAFDARLPFTLTAGQEEVSAQIAADLASPIPMHRLLQGEVGSGKTIVALRAMLTAVDAGAQAALLAPTEVLAAQHHRSITAMLGDLAEGGMLGGAEIGTRVALLTGSQSTAARRAALLDIASGDAGIVIGTHALLQEKVSFYDLALVVVDEQHRFGVEQRDALRGKAERAPHVLVMTATPIPRTVGMTVFGDMETSTLRELPAGRSPITTHVVDERKPNWVARTWQRVAEECRGGRQAYVVCPRIGDDDPDPSADAAPAAAAEPDDHDTDLLFADEEADRPELASVLQVHAELSANPDLAGLTIGLMHGRLPADEKDAVMSAFTRGELDVLVSTTVIEVGVDVPNATVMVVKDADRFGVSQLHQLRGRVGRGGHPGLCLLATHAADGPSRERLDAVAGSTDGFELALLDLQQRREGDILGTRQSGGRGRLRFLSLLDHEDVIADARADAQALIAADPELSDHPQLRATIDTWLAPEDADYLEKG